MTERMLTNKAAEATIEKAVKKYARSRGWLVYKFSSPGKRDVPDDQFMQSGWMFLIEFKADGKKPTPAQQREHRIIREQGGFLVFVIDGIDDGRWVVDQMTDKLLEVREAAEALTAEARENVESGHTPNATTEQALREVEAGETVALTVDALREWTQHD